MAAPVFYYDFSSPYAYLAASRIDDVLPVRPEWRPIAFGVIVQTVGKSPWSFQPDRESHFRDIDARAADRGLPPVRYPEGWPRETYSLAPLRAAMLARDQAQLRTLSHELYRTMFVEGRHLKDVEAVLDCAGRAGLDRRRVAEGLQRPEIKDRLRAVTQDAIEQGVTGVPTVKVGDRLFWGDDQLQAAAAGLSAVIRSSC